MKLVFLCSVFSGLGWEGNFEVITHDMSDNEDQKEPKDEGSAREYNLLLLDVARTILLTSS